MTELLIRKRCQPTNAASAYDAFDDARMKFDMRFYLVSILFIIFDLEVAFLFPWAVSFKRGRRVRFLVDDGVPRRADRRLRL
jgi:NADH:ubiquinone oxidoreductase subunit 3 (subunit A)